LTLQLLYPQKYPLLATEQLDGWFSEPGCTLEKRKSSFSAGNLVFIYLPIGPVTKASTLKQNTNFVERFTAGHCMGV
jgi:hypothetical protein